MKNNEKIDGKRARKIFTQMDVVVNRMDAVEAEVYAVRGKRSNVYKYACRAEQALQKMKMRCKEE